MFKTRFEFRYSNFEFLLQGKSIMAVKKAFTKLVCSACKTTNYFIKKTKKSAETKLELSKFCSSCHKHLAH